MKNETLMHLRKQKCTVPLEETAVFPALDQRIEDFVDMEQFHNLTAALNEKQRRPVFIVQIIRCFQYGQKPGQVGIASIPPAEPTVSLWLPVSIAMFLSFAPPHTSSSFHNQLRQILDQYLARH